MRDNKDSLERYHSPRREGLRREEPRREGRHIVSRPDDLQVYKH